MRGEGEWMMTERYAKELGLLGITTDGVEAALARELRKRVRKRLRALAALVAGQSLEQAAAAAETSPPYVESWLRRVRRSGFSSLLVDRRRSQARRVMTADEIGRTREGIAVALGGPLQRVVRARLVAVDRVLAGEPVEAAAARVVVLAETVRTWVRLVRRQGIDETLAQWEGRERRARALAISADPAALREIAAKQTNLCARKQLLALALVAEGITPHAAGLVAGVSHSALKRRILAFQEKGLRSCRERPRLAHPAKLSSSQIEELRAELQQRPETNYRQLREFILKRFGVRYAVAGLRELLRREFHIVWTDGRFTQATIGAGRDEIVGHYLNAAALRMELARTKDRQTARKLIALIQLAQGWDAVRVAFQVRTTVQTVAKWVNAYQASRFCENRELRGGRTASHSRFRLEGTTA
jgi:transposase